MIVTFGAVMLTPSGARAIVTAPLVGDDVDVARRVTAGEIGTSLIEMPR